MKSQLVRYAVAFGAIVIVAVSARADSWLTVPSTTSYHLHGITAASKSRWYAVGDKGTLLRSTDGGSTWGNQHASSVSVGLMSAAATDTIAIAVGERGEVIYTFSGEGKWNATPPSSDTLYSVSARSTYHDTTFRGADFWYYTNSVTQYWAAGAKGAFQQLQLVKQKRFYPGYPSYDSDTSYVNVVQIVPTTMTTIRSLILDQAVYAVGDEGAFLVTRNNGNTWTHTTIAAGVALNALVQLTPGTWLTVGNNGRMYRSVNDGVNWSLVSPPRLTENLNSVYFVNRDTGVVVGDNGLVLLTTNSGAEWIRQATNTFANLHSVAGANDGFSTTWVAVGDSGTIIESFRGGGTVSFTTNHDTIDFGDVLRGAKKKISLDFTNPTLEGYLTVRVRSLDPVLTAAPGQMIVEPLETKSVLLTYQPTDTGSTMMKLVITHDTSWTADTILARARCVTPEGQVSPSNIDFGIADRLKTATVQWRNTGHVDVVISSITFTDTSAFSTTFAVPRSISSGDSVTIAITLKGPIAHDVSALMLIKSNVEDGYDTVRLTARAAPANAIRSGGVAEAAMHLECFPNPARPDATIALRIAPMATGATVRVLSSNGLVVYAAPASTLGEGEAQLHLPVSGFYFCELVDANGVIATAPIIVR